MKLVSVSHNYALSLRAGTAWHSVAPPQALAPPTQMYAAAAPPTHYSGLPRQLVWAPPDSYAALHTQVSYNSNHYSMEVYFLKHDIDNYYCYDIVLLFCR